MHVFFKDVLKYRSTENVRAYSCNDEHIRRFATDVVAPILKKIHLSELEKKPFYLAIDEASNANIEYHAVAATYYQNNRDILPSNKLIALLQVEESCTGEALYKKLWDLLFVDETRLKRQKILWVS